MQTSLLFVLLSVLVTLAASQISEPNAKRVPLGTMRFGKRFAPIDDNSYEDYFPEVKRGLEAMEETERSIRAPLGTMRFGKRTPLGTMRFGKRTVVIPLSDIRSDKRTPLGTMRFGKK